MGADELLDKAIEKKTGKKPEPKVIIPKKEDKPDPPPPPPAAKLSDEELLEKINERNGTSYKSLDEIRIPEKPKTPEEIEAAAKARKASVRTYGIEKEIITPTDLVDYELDQAMPEVEFAFKQYREEFLAEIAGTEEEGKYEDDAIRELFENSLGLNDKEGSPRWKIGQKKIKAAKENYINTKHSKILNLDTDFENYQTITTKAQQYKGVVDSAFSGLPEKLDYLVDGVTIPFQPTKESIEAVKKIYLHKNAFNQFKDVPLTVEDFTEAITNSIFMQDHNALMTQVAQSYHRVKSLDLKKGRQGIFERSGEGAGTDTEGTTTESLTPRADEILEKNKAK